MRGRLILKTGAVLLLLLIMTVGVVAFFFRKSTIESSRETAMTVAQLVRATLTSYMVMGTMDRRDIFLEEVRRLHGLEYVRIIRGEAVIREYGKGRDYERAIKRIEEEVLRTGRPKDQILESKDKVVYEVVIPYRATSRGSVNCLQCHNVREGEVLGAISIAVDLTAKRQEALTTLGIYGGIAGVLFLTLFWIILRHFEPYRKLFTEMRMVLNRYKDGNFKERINAELRDEAGELAKEINLVGDTLDRTLSNVREKVSMLIGYTVMETENALKDTEKIVEELAKISHFKRAIEQDLRKDDIYARIETVLADYMSLDKFSIYEVDERKNAMKVITVQGEKLWCSEVILENADECRAKRTGEDVDSAEFPCICPRFAFNELCSTQGIQYYCIPVNIGGKVGNVVQIVYEKEMDMFIRMIIPYIKGYLQEASPVLESKSLMELLKQQSYIDQLTGLYNRRFLEEIADKISAQIKRRGTTLGVLMIDIDFFKEVNDRYGHDVGDRVLKEVAQVVKSSVREADYVIRFGGEEILVLLMDVKEGMSEKVAEKIRRNVESKTIEFSGGVIKKTVSVGVSEFPKDCGGMIWRCIKFADVALYRAKEEGRNRVVRFTPDMWTGEEY